MKKVSFIGMALMLSLSVTAQVGINTDGSAPDSVDPTITCSSMGWRGVDGGCKLKETGTTHWASPNTGATNSSGFTALPGGGRHYDAYFFNLGAKGYWWSATEYNSIHAWNRYLHYNNDGVGRSYDRKDHGFSVRCLRDY